jgi:hypothetical protein
MQKISPDVSIAFKTQPVRLRTLARLEATEQLHECSETDDNGRRSDR